MLADPKEGDVLSVRPEMVDFGFEQGLSDFSRSAGCYPARRDFPPGLFPTVGGNRRNSALFRGFQKSENAARSQKMPCMGGHYLAYAAVTKDTRNADIEHFAKPSLALRGIPR